MNGDDALVPPTAIHPGFKPSNPGGKLVSYTARPGFGSASAETSATVLMKQWLPGCHDGVAMYAEQPLDAAYQAISDQPRALLAGRSVVPPTATTLDITAGKFAGPNPKSPEATRIDRKSTR